MLYSVYLSINSTSINENHTISNQILDIFYKKNYSLINSLNDKNFIGEIFLNNQLYCSKKNQWKMFALFKDDIIQTKDLNISNNTLKILAINNSVKDIKFNLITISINLENREEFKLIPNESNNTVISSTKILQKLYNCSIEKNQLNMNQIEIYNKNQDTNLLLSNFCFTKDLIGTIIFQIYFLENEKNKYIYAQNFLKNKYSFSQKDSMFVIKNFETENNQIDSNFFLDKFNFINKEFTYIKEKQKVLKTMNNIIKQDKKKLPSVEDKVILEENISDVDIINKNQEIENIQNILDMQNPLIVDFISNNDLMLDFSYKVINFIKSYMDKFNDTEIPKEVVNIYTELKTQNITSHKEIIIQKKTLNKSSTNSPTKIQHALYYNNFFPLDNKQKSKKDIKNSKEYSLPISVQNNLFINQQEITNNYQNTIVHQENQNLSKAQNQTAPIYSPGIKQNNFLENFGYSNNFEAQMNSPQTPKSKFHKPSLKNKKNSIQNEQSSISNQSLKKKQNNFKKKICCFL